MFREILKNKVFYNFSILTICNLVVQLISILSSIRLARLLEPAGYGLFNLFFVQVSLFSIIGYLGLRLIIIRYIARNPALSGLLFSRSLRIRMVTTFLSVIACIVYSFFFSHAKFNLFLYGLLIIQLINTVFFDTVDAISYGHQVMKISAYLNLGFIGLWVLSVYLLPSRFFNIESLLLIQTINLVCKSVVYYIIVNRSGYLTEKGYTEQEEINYPILLKQGWPFFVLAVFTAITNQVPVLMLEHNSSMDQLGIFNLGYRILLPLQLVINTSFTALFPNLAVLMIKDKIRFNLQVNKAVLVISIVGSIGCIIFSLFSGEIVLVLYGYKYAASAIMISIQCWYTLLFGIFSLIGTVLAATDKQNLLSRLSIAYALISIPFFWLGSHYGAIGLSYAFLIGALINMSYHWYFFMKIMNNALNFRFTVILWACLAAIIAISILIVPQLNTISRFFCLLGSLVVGYSILVKVNIVPNIFKR